MSMKQVSFEIPNPAAWPGRLRAQRGASLESAADKVTIDAQQVRLLLPSAPAPPNSPAGITVASAWNAAAIKQNLRQDITKLFGFVGRLEPAVTIMGTSRKLPPGSREEELSLWVGWQVGKLGLPIRSGGGEGVMATVLRSYKESRDEGGLLGKGGPDLRTQAINIKLPWEQKLNGWVELSHEVGSSISLLYRELGLYVNSIGLAILPGGVGTVKELFDLWALKVEGVQSEPIGVDGRFWGGILGDLKRVAMDDRKLITPSEWEAVLLTDDRHQGLNLMEPQLENALTGHQQVRGDATRRLGERLIEQVHAGIDVLDKAEPAVTFLCSERLAADDPACVVAADIARGLEAGHGVVRLGNCGAAAEAILQAATSQPNATVQAFMLRDEEGRAQQSPLKQFAFGVDDATTKQMLLALKCRAIVAMPCDIRSFSDLLAVLVLAYVDAIPKVPIILVGKSYWEPLIAQMKQTMISGSFQTASAQVLDRVVITDDPKLALHTINSPVKVSVR